MQTATCKDCGEQIYKQPKGDPSKGDPSDEPWKHHPPIPRHIAKPKEPAEEAPSGAQAGGEYTPRLVILESPYAGDTTAESEQHRDFAIRCAADCLKRGEAPMASHLLYTLPGLLDDDVPAEREAGITAGLAWGRVAEASVVYVDHGITAGMRRGIMHAREHGRPVEMRFLDDLTGQE